LENVHDEAIKKMPECWLKDIPTVENNNFNIAVQLLDNQVNEQDVVAEQKNVVQERLVRWIS
jgi:hypothetical protein